MPAERAAAPADWLPFQIGLTPRKRVSSRVGPLPILERSGPHDLSYQKEQPGVVTAVQQAPVQESADSRSSRIQASVLLMALAAWFAANLTWVMWRLPGRTFNIDEAGYLSIALNATSGWHRGGLSGWWATVSAPSQQAPLTTTITSLAALAGGSPRAVGVTVVLVFATLALLFTWLAAEHVGGARTAWIATLIAATTPGFLLYAHQFTFVAPTTAAVAAAMWTLMRSDGMSRWGWSLAFGVSVGLIPLSRSMGLAFAAVFAVVALLQALARPGRWRNLLRWFISGVVAALMLIPWLWTSWRPVLTYLTGYGYGEHATEYALNSPGLRGVISVLSSSLMAAHTLVVAVGATVAVAAGVARLVRHRVSVGALVRSAAMVPVLVVGGGLAALSTTANAGAGFALQLLGPLAVLAGVGWSTLAGPREGRLRLARAGPVVALLVVGCLVALPGLVTKSAPTGTARVVTLPVVGELPLTEGVGTDDDYGHGADIGSSRNSEAWAAGWQQASDEIAATVLSTSSPSLTMGFRGLYLNVNTVQLSILEDGGSAIAVAQIDPQVTESTQAAYDDWLTGGVAALACVLATSDGSVNEFEPVVDTIDLEKAAQSIGYQEIRDLTTPDGRDVTLWLRPGCSATTSAP